MPSIVSPGIRASATSVPVVVSANNMQQEDPATSRSVAISKSKRALDKRARVPDHSRRTGVAVAFLRMIDESAFFNRRSASIGWAEDPEAHYFRFGSHRNEMIFERDGRSCYSFYSGISAEAFETDDLIEQTLPRKLG